jgi:hypothetical protein
MFLFVPSSFGDKLDNRKTRDLCLVRLKGYEVHVVSKDGKWKPRSASLLLPTEGHHDNGFWRAVERGDFTVVQRLLYQPDKEKGTIKGNYNLNHSIYHVIEMAEQTQSMHPEVELELEYDGYSITQFIYDLLLVRFNTWLLKYSHCSGMCKTSCILYATKSLRHTL